MTRQHTYKHMDDGTDPLKIRLDMRALVEQIEEANYGVHRLLSHLIDVRRAKHAKRVAEYRDGKHLHHRGIADRLEREGDELAEGINVLLQKGLF